MPLRQRALLFTIVVVAVVAYSYRRAKSLADRPVHIPGPAIQVEHKSPGLLEIVPADAKLNPGESRLIFARVLNESDHTYRYDSRIFVWKVLEANGGTLQPNGSSTLYYSYNAPTAPGVYHVLVGLKENPDIQATLAVVVGTTMAAAAPAPAPAGRKVAAEPARMPPLTPKNEPKGSAKGSANGAALPQ